MRDTLPLPSGRCGGLRGDGRVLRRRRPGQRRRRRRLGRGLSNGGSGSGRDSGLADALMNPVPTASADPTSGSRLKAQYMIADDGSKAYVPEPLVRHHAQRAARSPSPTASSATLPGGAAAAMYSNSTCTTPILAVPTGCTTPTYAVGTDTSTCTQAPDANHVFTVGPPRPGSDRAVHDCRHLVLLGGAGRAGVRLLQRQRRDRGHVVRRGQHDARRPIESRRSREWDRRRRRLCGLALPSMG